MNTIYSTGLLAVMVLCGCNKLIDIPDHAPNNITTSEVFKDSATAVNGVVGIYVNNFSSTGFLSGYMTIYPGLSADELMTTDNTDYADFYSYTPYAYSASNQGGSAGGMWNGAYGATLLYQANAAIEGVQASNGLTASLKAQLTGECKVIRDLTYFNLVNVFGAVPLVTSSSYLYNDKIARTSVDSMYNFLVTDLTEAGSLLAPDYPSEGHVRPNRYTAMALLAKVQLYRRQWAEAEKNATAVISSGMYSLETTLDNVFLDGSNEAIWQVKGVGYVPYATAEGGELLPYEDDIIPTLYLSDHLTQAFEDGDARKTAWTGFNTVDGVDYYYPYKYKNASFVQNGVSVEAYMMLRLAEQYLIRAEARAQQNDLAGAAEDLDMVRHRAGLDGTTAATKEALLSAILHERQTELFCEWGNRWLDLKRSGNASTVLAAAKPGLWPADGHAALYPIPGDQLRLDPALKQNPGY